MSLIRRVQDPEGMAKPWKDDHYEVRKDHRFATKKPGGQKGCPKNEWVTVAKLHMHVIIHYLMINNHYLSLFICFLVCMYITNTAIVSYCVHNSPEFPKTVCDTNSRSTPTSQPWPSWLWCSWISAALGLSLITVFFSHKCQMSVLCGFSLLQHIRCQAYCKSKLRLGDYRHKISQQVVWACLSLSKVLKVIHSLLHYFFE